MGYPSEEKGSTFYVYFNKMLKIVDTLHLCTLWKLSTAYEN